MTTTYQDLFAFVRAAARNPTTMGAVAPSAPRLCQLLAQVVPTTHPVVVVELGPGTGAVTDAISARLAPGSRHIAVEIDPALAARLRQRRPEVDVVTADAASLRDVLRDRGIAHVDAVASGLPWSLFPLAHQSRILTAIEQVLAPGAAFSTFAYLHASHLSGARRLRELLHTSFDEVIASRAVWRNLPPALTYTCRRPR